jgi:hypothetical protein
MLQPMHGLVALIRSVTDSLLGNSVGANGWLVAGNLGVFSSLYCRELGTSRVCQMRRTKYVDPFLVTDPAPHGASPRGCCNAAAWDG